MRYKSNLKIVFSVLIVVSGLTMAPGLVYAQDTNSLFGDLAEGPYNRLVLQNIMVSPGHGGPPVGPYDIEIEGKMIAKMTPFDPVTAERRGQTKRATGDRVID